MSSFEQDKEANGPATEVSVNEAGEVETNWDETTSSFDQMDLKELLLRGIFAYGFEKPSAIQQRAVKPILIGRDVIAQAQSGNFFFSCFKMQKNIYSIWNKICNGMIIMLTIFRVLHLV